MKVKSELLGGGEAELREHLDAQTRFRKVLHGFDPAEVTACLKTQKSAIEQLQTALEEEKKARTEEQCAFEEQQIDCNEKITQNKAELAAAKSQLAACRQKLSQTDRREQEFLSRQAQDAATIESLRTSSGAQAAEHLRAQLIAAARESSEAAAQLLAVRQKNKQLCARLEALSAEYDALSHLYAEAQKKAHERETLLVRDAARIRTLSRFGAAEAVQRLQETADLIAACFRENEALLIHLDGEPSAPAGKAQPDTEKIAGQTGPEAQAPDAEALRA